MKRRGVFRRVVLPVLWVVIGALVAASLVKLAFLGGTASARGEDPLKPTGEVPAETVTVERGDVTNDLSIEGTIKLDPARSALASTEGELAKVYRAEGSSVAAGERLFDIRTEKEPVAAAPPMEGEAPRPAATPRKSWTYTTVKAPVAGRVGTYAMAVGDPVTKGASVVSVQPHTFKAVGDITPLDRYRLLSQPVQAEVTIKGGPKPFLCGDLAVGDAASTTPAPGAGAGGVDGPPTDGGSASAASVSCRVPGEVTVFDGLTMSMKIPAGVATGVLTVPVTAVRGLLGNGTVWVVGKKGGEPTEREVKLGVTDGKAVEVQEGLTEGESVMRYVPGSTPEEGNMEGDMRMMMG